MPLDLSKISEAESRRLRVLFVIRALADGQSRHIVPRDQIRAALDAEPNMLSSGLDDLLIQLHDAELAHVYRSIAGVQSAAVLPLGATLAAEFDAGRRSLISKRAGLKNAYLRWIYEEQLSGRRTSQEDFLEAKITFHGNPYTPAELASASEWLEKEGFIEGPGAWGASGPLLPKLTSKGEHTVENNKSVSDATPAGGNTFNTTVHGYANIAQASSNFS